LTNFTVQLNIINYQEKCGSPSKWAVSAQLDFILWGCVKDKVYVTKVTGVEDLKTRIRDVITTINRGMLART
jgi:hypothetical protein